MPPKTDPDPRVRQQFRKVAAENLRLHHSPTLFVSLSWMTIASSLQRHSGWMAAEQAASHRRGAFRWRPLATCPCCRVSQSGWEYEWLCKASPTGKCG